MSNEISPRVFQLNVNPKGGVPKYPVLSARLEFNGVAGDKQRNLKFHGGPTRAVCLYSLEVIKALQQEGHPIQPGNAGENLTVVGLDWPTIKPGVKLRVGAALLEITAYTAPCRNIERYFVDLLSERINHSLHPGWSRVYARVLEEATVRPGDAVELFG